MSTHGTHTSGEKPATAGCKDDSSVRVSPVSGDDYGHQYDQGGELKKGFGLFALLCIALNIGSAWVTLLVTYSSYLYAGGTVLAIWGTLYMGAGTMLLALSLGEMASAFPITNGSIEWAYQFASARFARPLSFQVGWLALWGFIFGNIANSLFASHACLAIASALNPEFTYTKYTTWGLAVSLIAFTTILNLFVVKWIPKIEVFGLIWFFTGFFLWLIVPISMAPVHQTAKMVFFNFINDSGWDTRFMAFMIGSIGLSAGFAGVDIVTRLAEEMHNPSIMIPKVMWISVALSTITAFLVQISVQFTIVDIQAILATPTGMPFVQVAIDAVDSRAAWAILCSFIAVVLCLAILQTSLASSRILWAFARDGGVPGSKILARVNSTFNAPLSSVVVSFLMQFGFSLIYLGSTTAMTAILSTIVVLANSSYVILLGSLLFVQRRRYRAPGPFHLGKYGWAINVGALIFLVFNTIFNFFPYVLPAASENMNYTSVVAAGVILIQIAFWYIGGRRQYMLGRIHPSDQTDVTVGADVIV